MGARCSTQIANAYKENVWIKIDGDKSSVCPWKPFCGDFSKIQRQTSTGSLEWKELDWHKIEMEFQLLRPGGCLRVDVPVTHNKPTVYITIVTASGKVLIDSLPKIDDICLIITARGQITNSGHGKVWIDVTGQRHSPLKPNLAM